jgi:hypothetical protein
LKSVSPQKTLESPIQFFNRKLGKYMKLKKQILSQITCKNSNVSSEEIVGNFKKKIDNFCLEFEENIIKNYISFEKTKILENKLKEIEKKTHDLMIKNEFLEDKLNENYVNEYHEKHESDSQILETKNTGNHQAIHLTIHHFYMSNIL